MQLHRPHSFFEIRRESGWPLYVCVELCKYPKLTEHYLVRSRQHEIIDARMGMELGAKNVIESK